ncbi:MAG: hypothetical protein K2W96_25145, partial [Gemmataceae bacterium]|nr:hypothetical protein [Gemmataceae bacterium]
MIAAVARMRMIRLDRNGRLGALRFRAFLLVAAELLLLPLLALAHRWSNPKAPIDLLPIEQGRLFVGWLDFLTRQQAALALVVGPTFAAGAVADEKAAGTLDHLLLAPLAGRDIAWGLWLAFSAQLCFLLLPGLPAVALLAGWSGLDLFQAVAMLLAPFALVPGAVAASLLASALARRTTAALVGVYCAFAALLAAAWLLDAADWIDPASARLSAEALGWQAAASAGVAVLGVPLAGWLLRPVHLRQMEARPSPLARWRPAMGDDPIRWRERWTGASSWLAAGLLVAGAWAVRRHPVMLCCLAVLLVALLGAVRASSIVASERERGTWTALLLL